MSNGSFQHEKPPARINIFLEVKKDGALKKLELPLRLMVLGDFSMRKSDKTLEERDKTNINKDNFEKVMQASELGLQINVKDRLTGGEDPLKVNLKFNNLNSFRPEEVAKQVPELSKLLATRNLLQDLRDRIINKSEFRKKLEEIVKDQTALAKLTEEIEKLTPPTKVDGQSA